MDKYIDLKNYLLYSKKEQIHMSFNEIEQILGFSLPPSAYVHKPWWANGGHSQANAWLDVGYKVSNVNLKEKEVTFCKANTTIKTHKTPATKMKHEHKQEFHINSQSTKTMTVFGYKFSFLQTIKPLCDDNNNIIKFYPQEKYDNKNNFPLSKYGNGAFCRFSIEAPQTSGVYLWVVDNAIIYIGETENLSQRFNIGYGNISPRNCYVGGQSTNCKMNKIVLELYEQGKIIDLYFYETKDYKSVELDLLRNMKTPYNVKDNKK